MGRFGKAASRPFYDLITKGGGRSTQAFKECLRWWQLNLPKIAPRLIRAPPEREQEMPVRIYSDAAGEGDAAGLLVSPEGSNKLPLVFSSKAGRALDGLAAQTSKIYIFELFAAVAAVFALKTTSWQTDYFVCR